MADKFDIAEHIKVEAFGQRVGTLTTEALYVNNKEYNQNDYVISDPNAQPRTTESQLDVLVSGDFRKVTLNFDGDYSSVDVYSDIDKSVSIYAIESDSHDLDISMEPITAGTLIKTATLNVPSGGGVGTIQLPISFQPADKFYLFAAYAGTTLLGKGMAGKYLLAAYTYSFTGSISATNSNEWRSPFYTSDLRRIRASHETYIVPRDTRATGGAENYNLYFNGTLASALTLEPGEVWSPPNSSDATWQWVDGENTLELYLATDTYGVDTPQQTLTVEFGYTLNYPYPTYYNPIVVEKVNSTRAKLIWSPLISHIGQTEYPSDLDDDTLIDVYGSNNTIKLIQITDPMPPAYNVNGDITRMAAVTIDSLDMNVVSYLFEMYFVEASQNYDIFLWHTATYGNNPPEGPFDIDYVVATGWWPVECSVSSVDITVGYDIEKSLLKRPEPGTMSLTMQGPEADPRVNTAITLDVPIKVSLDAAASPDAGVTYSLFYGFIESMSTTYDVRGNSTTQVRAIDSLSKAMNVTIPLYEYTNEESFSVRMDNVFNDYIIPNTVGVQHDTTLAGDYGSLDRSDFPPEFRSDVSSSEIITELTEGEYAIMYQAPNGVINFYNRALPALIVDAFYDYLVSQPESFGFSTVHDPNSLDHFCIGDFQIYNDVADITNYVTASLSYDDLTKITYTDQDSIDVFGQRAYEVELNLDAPDGNPSEILQRWVDEVPSSEAQSELRSVTTNVVNRKGYVTRAFLNGPGIGLVRVFIQTGPVDVNGAFFIRQVRHQITPNNWIMEADLTAD